MVNNRPITPKSQVKSIDDLLLLFQGVKKAKGDSWTARCPAHEDKKNSLSIAFKDNKALLYCFAGCDLQNILKSIHLETKDLFFDKSNVTNIYQYQNSDNTLNHEKLRYQPKKFTQRRLTDDGSIAENLDGIKRVPYNYPNVIKAIKQGSIVLYTEGEKDADTGKILGYTATTFGSASDWKEEYAQYFKLANIVLIPDKDDAGLKLTSKMIDSLKPIVKSIKAIVLPDGKDLTEWVESGNRNLQGLIDNTAEQQPQQGLAQPVVEKKLNGYQFTWQSINLTIYLDRLSTDGECYIAIKENNTPLGTNKVNVFSERSLTMLSNKLSKQKRIDWVKILDQIAIQISKALADSGVTEDISQPASCMKVHYLIDPVLPFGEPTTIMCSGGKGKSVLADYLSVLCQYGIAADGGLPFIPMGQRNVLYLDWEAQPDDHRRYITAIKQGLNVTDHSRIAYRRLSMPLNQIADGIREEIDKENIDLIIVDSQMAATATGTRGMTEAQVASEYYNILMSFGKTSLTIDHITKTDMRMDNGVETAYGSIVKYNRARAIFEYRLGENFGDTDHKEYALIPTKFNLARRPEPIGISVDFQNNGDYLEQLTFSSCELTENASLVKVVPRYKRLLEALQRRGGSVHYGTLAGDIGEIENADKINMQMANDKKHFTKDGNGFYSVRTY